MNWGLAGTVFLYFSTGGYEFLDLEENLSNQEGEVFVGEGNECEKNICQQKKE